MTESKSDGKAKFCLGDFISVLKFLEFNNLGGNYVLVGGQAVGIWRKKYFPQEAEIFGKDIDMRASREIAKRMAANFNITIKEYSFPNGCVMRCLMIPYKGETKLQVDLQNTIPGLDQGIDAAPQGIAVRLRHKEAGEISVIDPLSLFISKLTIFANSPIDANFNDEDHMNILAKVIPVYLQDTIKDYQNDKLRHNPAIIANRLAHEIVRNMDKIPQGVKHCKDDVLSACHTCRETLGNTFDEMYF